MSENLSAYTKGLHDTQREMERLFDLWVPLMGLDHWQRVTTAYEPQQQREKPAVCACTDVQWEYMTARITVYLPVASDLPREQLQYVVVHELCHLLVNEMRGGDITAEEASHEERVVTTLAMAYLRTAHAFQNAKPTKKGKAQ